MARVKGILLNNWPVIFKSLSVMIAKETSRNSLRLKEIKMTWSPNRVLDWNLLLKHIFWPTGEI